LYEEVRLRNALRTGEYINAPDWVSDLASCLALAVTLANENEIPRLAASHDRSIEEHKADKRTW
jgi:hypothetical protein